MFSTNDINNNNNSNTTSTTTTSPMNSLFSFDKRNCNRRSRAAGTDSTYRYNTDTIEEDDTSVCSSVSALTDDEQDDHGALTTSRPTPAILAPTSITTPTVNATRMKKSRFAITKARVNATTQSSPASDAVSISFLHVAKQPNPGTTPLGTTPSSIGRPTQVIQKALAGLRPGGVFFVLDYKDEANQPCPSMAMKEIPQDLVEKWSLTMVPTNLETFYNTKLKLPSSKPAAPRTSSLPASKRIVRWMGIKPRQQVSPAAN
ncbi:expressed unknown protein [Seminavis robusta]|uniref:Uncharacterized protein n=1 Tax=Seminavis robusta TaxID=568900 RepID=A0A9N8DSY6_9STRA|nr:expressed unknown protein [Seminavis robusta]|eukprot:Sro259_g101220.1 n/a (260) ;mRNA; f:2319-3098